MPTQAAPADQEKSTVEITGLARAMMDNGIDSETVGMYLANRNKDRNVAQFLQLLAD